MVRNKKRRKKKGRDLVKMRRKVTLVIHGLVTQGDITHELIIPLRKIKKFEKTLDRVKDLLLFCLSLN